MISLLLIVALVGLLAWALVTFVPMPEGMKKVIIIVAVVFAVLIILKAFGIWTGGDVEIPQVR